MTALRRAGRDIDDAVLAERRAGRGLRGSQVNDLAIAGNREDRVTAGVRADGECEFRLAPGPRA